MKGSALIAALLVTSAAIGCATKAAKPKPTAADVVSFKDEARIVGEEAKLNAPWSQVQLAKIDSQTAALQHHYDQLAEAAGIGTTVEAKKAK